MSPLLAGVVIIIGIILYVSSLMVEIAGKDVLISQLTTRAAELQRDLEHQNATVERIYQESEDSRARSERAMATARASSAAQRAEMARMQDKISNPKSVDCEDAISEIRRTFKK